MISKKKIMQVIKLIYPETRKIKKTNKGYSHNIFELETNNKLKKAILKVCIQDRKEWFSLKKEAIVNQILHKIRIPVPKVIKIDDSKKIIPLEFMVCSYAPGIDLEDI